MKENYIVCNCKQIWYADIAHAIEKHDKFEDVEKVFEDVQKETQCSTGCGGCHNKVMDIISEILNSPSKI
ncbi:MAG: (2Fe-2S)-binding protein [Clostridia bacterium]|nr:(2Fe-2S)-binding protein [Clostridia bacterium]